GEVLPASHIERVLRDYYAGKLGDADLEDRLLRNVDEDRFRAICENALEGLASKKLNLAMLIERRARAQERRVVPETIARFIREAAEYVPLKLRVVENTPHTFEPGRTPAVLTRYEREPDWKLPAVAARYPRCSTDRETAERHSLEWVTPGHPLFEALRRHVYALAAEAFVKGACFYSLQHDEPSRLDFYRARVVDGLGHVVHERLFAVEITANGEYALREPSVLGNFTPAEPPAELPAVAAAPEATAWLYNNALQPFLEETRKERIAEVDRVAEHV
ncbi:MAG: helicase, partial [Firmicutes bacterium]|nr:helicase [Bacillota bacterium]